MRILFCMGSRPDHMEAWAPIIKEAKRRKWKTRLVSDNQSTADAAHEHGIDIGKIDVKGGHWDDSYKVLSVPGSREIFDAFKPDVVVTSVAGHGMPGTVWLEEAHRRQIPAVEIQSPAACFVWLHSAETRQLTAQYLKALRRSGYGGDFHKMLRRTEAQRWVGFMLGDSLSVPVSRAKVMSALGVSPKRRLVIVAPTWSKKKEIASILSEDLALWSKKAGELGITLAFSPHPNTIEGQGFLPEVEIPPQVPVTANWRGELWGRRVKVVPSMDLVRAASFVIHHWHIGHTNLCLAAGTARWLKYVGRARTSHFERREGAPVWMGGFLWLMTPEDQKARDWPPRWWYRSDEELDLLFRGELEFDEERAQPWRDILHLRLDGRVSRRVLNLLARAV